MPVPMIRGFLLILFLLTGSVLLADDVVENTRDQVAATARSLPEPPLKTGQDPVSLSRDPNASPLRTLTIEGEDKISIEFGRPEIGMDLDPRSAPGLGWIETWDQIAFFPALTSRTALDSAVHLGTPWIQSLAQDDVVVFRPEAPEMNSWRLTIVDVEGNRVSKVKVERSAAPRASGR